MEHEADPHPHGDDPQDLEPLRMDWALRLLEGIMFCCLSTLILFWIADRMRDVDFEPISVTPCVAEDCAVYVGPDAGSSEAVFAAALERRGTTSFSPINVCTNLAQIFETRGEDGEGVEHILDQMTARGTVAIERLEDGVIQISPGVRNDGLWDVIRDAFRTGGPRGCHPINYQAVFYPLGASWILLAGLRLFRGRQAVWAARAG